MQKSDLSLLEQVKLKEIWDLSNVRKAPHLTRIEFFSACRYVALSQNNQALNLNNLLVFNNNNKTWRVVATKMKFLLLKKQLFSFLLVDLFL